MTENNISIQIPSPVQRIEHPLFEQKKVIVDIKRDDLIHKEISGNKWRKLKYNLLAAQKSGYKTITTFGGAYSNHIAATAAAGKYYGFKTVGIIRGESYPELNETLKTATEFGMQLEYVSREEYRSRHDETWLNKLKDKYPN